MSPLEIPAELEAQIIRRLAETADRNKVVEELCIERGLHWAEADEIVEHVTQVHHSEVTRQQSPFLVLLSISIFLGGVLLMAWNLMGAYNYFWYRFDPKSPDVLGFYLLASDTVQFLNAPPLFITGLAMVVGSYFGMKDVWSSVFDWFDQRRTVSRENSAPELTPYYENGTPSKTEFAPNQEVLDYIFDHLDKGQSQAQIVEELWLKFSIPESTGLQLLRQVLSIAGKDVSGESAAVVMLAALGGVLAGSIWVFQFIFMLIRYLSGISRPLQNSWHLLLWLSDIAHYVGHFPGQFGLFLLGLVFLAGGIYGLKDFWSFLFLMRNKPLN